MIEVRFDSYQEGENAAIKYFIDNFNAKEEDVCIRLVKIDNDTEKGTVRVYDAYVDSGSIDYYRFSYLKHWDEY